MQRLLAAKCFSVPSNKFKGQRCQRTVNLWFLCTQFMGSRLLKFQMKFSIKNSGLIAPKSDFAMFQ
jgi:hypothetical protein